jgi:thioredoxin reductase (NADPH)
VLGLDGALGDDMRLVAVQLITDSGENQRLPVELLLAFLGVSPKLGPIAKWGLALERRQLQVDTAHFETSTPGIFAVGDVNTYPGKKKLILCGFHEATLAAFAAAARLRPGQPALLQYTTTSPRLHQLLGVATPHRQD